MAVLYLGPLLLNAPLTDPDEGLHAAISQEMVERGDLVVPRLLGQAFLDKPILFFWSQAASLRIFGMNTAAARLPGFLFAIFGIATTGWLAALLVDRRRGWVAATCYATMVLPFLLAQAPVHDIALVPFTNLALLFLVNAGRDSGLGLRDSLRAGAVLGCSILTKGLEGVAIVGVAYALYLVLTRSVAWRFVVQGIVVLSVALLVATPWYLAMNARVPGYLHYYFVERHLLAFATQTQEHSGQPWWFYLPLLAGGGLPWIVFVRSRGDLLAWTWLLGALVLLTLSGSKAVTYLLPAMPAVAILAARTLGDSRIWSGIAIGACVVYTATLAIFGPSLARSHSARDLADYFNGSGHLPATIFVMDQRVSFIYYLRSDLRRQLQPGQIQSVSAEQLAAMAGMLTFPRDAVVALPADLAAARLRNIPALDHGLRREAGRYVVVSP